MAEIILGKGYQGDNTLWFGLKERKVIEIYGSPDKIYKVDDGARHYQYFDRRLDLQFAPEDGDRLDWIEVHHPEASLFGERLIGRPQLDVVDFVSEKIISTPEVEDYGNFETFFFEPEWLELQFEFGQLTCINFGVFLGDDEEPIWPDTISL